MGQRATTSANLTALDLLDSEDREIRALFNELENTRDSSVETRAKHGDLAKQLIRHVATRESALTDVVNGLSHDTTLGDVADRMDFLTDDRRILVSRLEHMSRGVQGINLNTGQDFDGELETLMQLMRKEIDWELSTAIPSIRDLTDASTQQEAFHSAHHTRRHAPTNLSPGGPRWYERAPLLSRIVTVYDHLRDFPRASRGSRHSHVAPPERRTSDAAGSMDR
ncbi:MAG TPA: hypothetical protein VHV57_12800 [Acidimicrobiales bacterium]|jgi:hypothetical protein|nr:hypothetical protein [Acidimicrobiales bacterium]